MVKETGMVAQLLKKLDRETIKFKASLDSLVKLSQNKNEKQSRHSGACLQSQQWDTR